MAVSVFDLFTIGIGPSSSHTVGPMRAARMFARRLREPPGCSRGRPAYVPSCSARSAPTGHGHGTPQAVLLGLEGSSPRTVDPALALREFRRVQADRTLRLLGGGPEIAFDLDERPGAAPPPVAALPPERHALPRVRRRRRSAAREDLLLGRRRVRRRRRRGRSRPREARRHVRAATRSARAPSCCAERATVGSRRPRAHARERARLARRRRRSALRLLDIWRAMQACVDARLRAPRACCPAGCSVRRRAPALRRRAGARGGAGRPAATRWTG